MFPSGFAAALGLVAFRFPLGAGLPVLVLSGAFAWLVVDALKGFSTLGPVFSAPRVQPLTDREMVTIFSLRADFLDFPGGLPLVPQRLYRLRTIATDPGEWWWTWAVSRGWARSVGAALPLKPLKFGVYRLSLGGNPVWILENPELSVPDDPSD